jgi:O-antigen/teichoic acid export membrane protein
VSAAGASAEADDSSTTTPADSLALRRVARGGSLAAVGTAIAAALGFALTLVVTHALSTHSAGIFFATTAAFLVVQTVVSFGVGAGVVRFIPRMQTLGRTADIPALLFVALVPVAVVGVIVSVACLFAAPYLAKQFDSSSADQAVGAVRILALMILPGALEVAVVECTRGFGSIRQYVTLQQLLVPFARPLLVWIVIALGAPLWIVVFAWAVPLALALFLAAIVVRSALRRTGESAALDRATLRRVAAEYWAFTGARGFAAVLDIVLTWLDVILVAALVSPTQAAIYAAASRFITSGTLVMQALRLALAPELSRALANEERERASVIYQLATQWIIVTSWPLYLVMAVFAPCILRVFGPAYPAGATALSVLSVAMLVNLATGPVGTVLLMAGKSRWVLADKVAVVAVNVAGNLLLIPHLGINGAAIAWAVSIVLDSALAVGQVRYGMRIGGSLRVIAWCAALAVACYGVVCLAWRLIAGTSLPVTIAGVVVATAIYLPLIWRVRERIGLTMLVESVGLSGRRGRRMPLSASPQS